MARIRQRIIQEARLNLHHDAIYGDTAIALGIAVELQAVSQPERRMPWRCFWRQIDALRIVLPDRWIVGIGWLCDVSVVVHIAHQSILPPVWPVAQPLVDDQPPMRSEGSCERFMLNPSFPQLIGRLGYSQRSTRRTS